LANEGKKGAYPTYLGSRGFVVGRKEGGEKQAQGGEKVVRRD